MKNLQSMWISNGPVESEDAAHLAVVNPANEELIACVPQGCAADADRAVEAARRAFAGWSALSPVDRRLALRVAANNMQVHADTIARTLTLENGKPIGQAMTEVGICVDMALAFGELAVHLRGGTQGSRLGDLVFQCQEPRGVVACIVPWNWPLVAGLEGVLPALAVGNVVVMKPSEKTPLSTRFMVEQCFGHFPPGVLNVLLGSGPGSGEPLVRHPDVDAVVFIGSEATGRRIGRICGEALKKCILELGGKDPMIIDETADLQRAARLAAESAYGNAGQNCTATERVYVARTIFDEFVAVLCEQARGLKVGDGMLADTQMGPIVDTLQLAKLERQIADARERGAEVVWGGRRLLRKGYFLEPAVLTDISADMLMMREETFGPLAPVIPFDDFDEAISLANASTYGLSAIVCTASAVRAMKALQTLDAGMIKINTLRGKAPGATSEPRKASGLGHGYGIEVMQELTRQKSVHWRAEL